MNERQEPSGDKPAHEQTNEGAAESGWDPDEQVGDIYQVELEPGQPPEIRKLEEEGEPPRVWVGSWLDYNHGVLYGEWLDAAREADELWTDIAAMLAASPTARQTGQVAEDWGIFDYENFGPLKVGEQETVAYVTAVARGIAEHGPAFAAWADVVEDEEMLGGFTDAYLGEYESVEAYAQGQIDEAGYDELLDHVVPEPLRPYVQIDIAGLARDMELSGDVHSLPAEDGGVWLFDGRS